MSENMQAVSAIIAGVERESEEDGEYCVGGRLAWAIIAALERSGYLIVPIEEIVRLHRELTEVP